MHSMLLEAYTTCVGCVFDCWECSTTTQLQTQPLPSGGAVMYFIKPLVLVQNDPHFADDIFKCISIKKDICILV